MTDREKRTGQSKKKMIALVFVTVLAAFVVLLALVISATSPASGVGTIASASYASALATARAEANVEIGERLVTETDCATCHLTGEGRTAPLFGGLASMAGARRPPLNAEQYLYEAIVYPAAHLVDGYANAMPIDYGDRFSLTEIGHMIAYLLTLTAEAVEA